MEIVCVFVLWLLGFQRIYRLLWNRLVIFLLVIVVGLVAVLCSLQRDSVLLEWFPL